MADSIKESGSHSMSKTSALVREQSHTECKTEEILDLDQGELESKRFSNIWSIIGVQFSVTGSPLAIGAYLQLVLGAGGSPFVFWGFLVAMCGQFLVGFSLAELSSAYPHTSGTVYWVLALAPRSCFRFLSYLNGMMTCLGWLFVLTANVVYAANFMLAFATLDTDYVPQLWHGYLTGVACLAISSLVNTVGIRSFPFLTKFLIVFINASVVFIFLTLLITAHPKASASAVFTDVVNETGWTSDSLVFFLALLPGVSVISMFDSATHLSEELPQPEKQVPRVMLLTNILNAITTTAMLLALLFCLVHPENLLTPLGGIPILQLCWDAYPSMPFVKAVAFCYVISFVFATATIQFAASRLIWSFAKSGALPCYRWITVVNPRFKVPVNATVLTGFLSALILLLVLGPSTVLNGLLGSAVIFMAVSYSMPILLLLKRRRALPSKRIFNLGRLGPAINIASLCWISVIVVFLSFPMYQPLTLNNMNWASVCALGLTSLVLLNWLLRRKDYILLHGLYVEGLHGHFREGLEAN